MVHRLNEILIVVDEDDNVIGKSPYSEVRKKGLITRSSNIFIFSSEGKIFIHKRNRQLSLYPGMWDVKVGGSVSYGESYEDAALRELKEETGIIATEEQLEYLFSTKFRSNEHNVSRKIFRIIYDGKMTLQKSEIEEGRFVSIKEAEKLVKDGLVSPSAKEVFERYLAYLNKQKFS